MKAGVYLCTLILNGVVPLVYGSNMPPISSEQQEISSTPKKNISFANKEIGEDQPFINDQCPAIPGYEDASADTLRQAISLLNAQSTFTTEDVINDEIDKLLYTIFGKKNYIQLLNPTQAGILSQLKLLLTANPDMDEACVLRFYLTLRGVQSAPSTALDSFPPVKVPSGIVPATATKQPPIQKEPASAPSTSAGGTKPSAPASITLDLKPLTDATTKLNSALARLRNAKTVKISIEQRKELKKEAEKFLKENNSRIKALAQRVNRIAKEPGINQDKLAPFKRFADLYDSLEREISRI